MANIIVVGVCLISICASWALLADGHGLVCLIINILSAIEPIYNAME